MNNGKFRIPCNKRNFFKRWLLITKPFHKIRPRQIEVLTEILYHHDMLKDDYKDEIELWKVIFDYSTKLKIRNDLNIEDHIIQNSLSILRKSGIIKNNKVIDRYIPIIKNNKYELKFEFIIDG
tara:strand:+ start:8881 stop:9249 length:369 start_codon:yes stop_codon:yes gene_type:complete